MNCLKINSPLFELWLLINVDVNKRSNYLHYNNESKQYHNIRSYHQCYKNYNNNNIDLISNDQYGLTEPYTVLSASILFYELVLIVSKQHVNTSLILFIFAFICLVLLFPNYLSYLYYHRFTFYSFLANTSHSYIIFSLPKVSFPLLHKVLLPKK